MSRKAKFTVKLSADLAVATRHEHAVFGDNRDTDAIELVKRWAGLDVLKYQSLVALRVKVPRKTAERNHRRWKAEYIEKLVGRFDHAVRTGDGEFFSPARERD